MIDFKIDGILAPMTWERRVLIVILLCAVVTWLAGAPGRFLVAGIGVLIIPGFLVERLLPPLYWREPFAQVTIWLGLSLSTIAVFFQWTTTLRLPIYTPQLIGLALLCIILALWVGWSEDTCYPPQTPHSAEWHTVIRLWASLLVVLALTFWTRVSQIRDLVVPAWVDPVHHTLLIRVVNESGFAPISLRPYLPIDYLPYHWGYHVVMATIVQLTDLDIPWVMLWEGQILNTLHVLTCAALASVLWRKPFAGVVAGIIVGLVSLMPAYYVSWGRYTHLTGLLVLPPLVIAWDTWLRSGSRRWMCAIALLLAGLSIIHFLVLVVTLCWLVALTIIWAIDAPWATIRERFVGALGLSFLAIALAIPWLWVLVMARLAPAVSQPQQLISGGNYVAVTEGLLWAGTNRFLIALALFAAFWGVYRRMRPAVMVFGWASLLVLFANPWMMTYLLPASGIMLLMWAWQERQWLVLLVGIPMLFANPFTIRFPYTWVITNDIIAISLFIGLGVLIGGWLTFLYDWLLVQTPTRWHQMIQAGSVALLIIVSAWGTWQLREVLNPATILATSEDMAAIAWIDEHTPPNARFLINAASWYADADRGTDGGYWLLPLTGRWTSTPPALFTYAHPDYARATQQRSQIVSSFKPGDEPVIDALIKRERITHIYLNHRTGPLTLDSFTNSERYPMIYNQDDVVILEVRDVPERRRSSR